MNKKIITSILWIVYISKAIAQNYEPSILILSPYETFYDKQLQKEIDKYNFNLPYYKEQFIQQLKAKQTEYTEIPKNLKIMLQKQLEFAKNYNLFSVIPARIEFHLKLMFFQQFKNLMIYAVNNKTECKIDLLSSLAEKYKLQYIVNIPKVSFIHENDSNRVFIRVQLFDNKQKKFILDKEYSKIVQIPDIESTFIKSSRTVTYSYNIGNKDEIDSLIIKNTLNQLSYDIYSAIYPNIPKIVEKNKLAQEQENILFSQIPDKQIPNIIKSYDSLISISDFYRGFMNENKTKFIGFFASNGTNITKSHSESFGVNKNRNYKFLKTEDRIDTFSGICTYMVYGVNYDSRWFISRNNVTENKTTDLDSIKKTYLKNLSKWNFFKENSIEFNPDFWETIFFKKVSIKDYKKDNWNNYSHAVQKQIELNYQPYIGLYKIVADKMEEEEKYGPITYGNTRKFKPTIGEQISRPFLEKLQNEFPDEYVSFKFYTFLDYKFSNDLSAIFNSVIVKNKKEERINRYFVVFPEAGEVYEWTYIKPVIINKGDTVDKEFDKLFNSGGTSKTFWKKYILKKKHHQYIYLKKLINSKVKGF